MHEQPPPYGSYPPQNQPPEGTYPGYEQQASAYPPPPPYGAAPYPPQPGQRHAPMYGAPQIYVQPAAYPYMVAAPAEPGSGEALTSMILGIVGTVFGLMSWLLCLAFIPVILGIVGFIMGILGRKFGRAVMAWLSLE